MGSHYSCIMNHTPMFDINCKLWNIMAFHLEDCMTKLRPLTRFLQQRTLTMNDSTLIDPGHMRCILWATWFVSPSNFRGELQIGNYICRGVAPAKMIAPGACELHFSCPIFYNSLGAEGESSLRRDSWLVLRRTAENGGIFCSTWLHAKSGFI